MERRNSVRIETSVGVDCRMPATPQQVTVRDLSLTGCRIAARKLAARVGTTVRIDVNDRTSVTGSVVWVQDNTAGIRFDRPLDLARYAILDWVESAEPGLSLRLTVEPDRNTQAA